MAEPIITDEARDDLDAAWDYLAARSLKAADRLIDGFVAAARRHAQFPALGQKRDEVAPGPRCFTVSPYVAFCRIEANAIVVLRLLHGHRDARRVLGEDREDEG